MNVLLTVNLFAYSMIIWKCLNVKKGTWEIVGADGKKEQLMVFKCH